MKEFLTLQEVAEWLGVSSKTVSRLILNGKVPAMKVGGLYRIRLTDIEEYIERQRVLPHAKSKTSSHNPNSYSTQDNAPDTSMTEGLSCGRCQRLLRGLAYNAGNCQEASCDVPLCQLCWSNEYDRYCRKHKHSYVQKLNTARQRLADFQIQVLVTTEEARKRELVFLHRFNQKIRENSFFISPIDGGRYQVGSWDDIHTEGTELDQSTLASLRLLQPDLEPQLLPQNLSSVYMWPPPNGHSRRARNQFMIAAFVLSDLPEMAINGFSTSPTNRSRLLKIVEEKTSAAKAAEAFYVLGLASTTGWSREAVEMMEGGPKSHSFSSLYVAVCLIDLETNSLFYNAIDKRLRPYISLYRGELDEEAVLRVADWVRQELFSGKTSLSVAEAAAGTGVEQAFIKEAFLHLEADGGFIMDNIPGFGLTISRKI